MNEPVLEVELSHTREMANWHLYTEADGRDIGPWVDDMPEELYRRFTAAQNAYFEVLWELENWISWNTSWDPASETFSSQSSNVGQGTSSKESL